MGSKLSSSRAARPRAASLQAPAVVLADGESPPAGMWAVPDDILRIICAFLNSFDAVHFGGTSSYLLPLAREGMTALRLSDYELGLKGARALTQLLPKLGGLHVLDLHYNHLGDKAVSRLAAVLPKLHIYDLRLGANAIGRKGSVALAKALVHCRDLEQLHLPYNPLTPQGLEAILKSVRCLPDLAVIDVGGTCRPTEAAWQALAECRNLEWLGLAHNRLEDGWTEDLASLLPFCPMLQSLVLWTNDISPVGATYLGDALVLCPQITHVDLASNPLTPGGVRGLVRNLPLCRYMRELSLSSTLMKEEGGYILATVLPDMKLTTLDIRFNNIGDGAAVAVGRALEGSPLEVLMLDGNAIGAECMRALAASLQSCTALRRLLVHGNPLGDLGLAHLCDRLAAMESLVELDVSFCLVETSGAERLARTLPASSLKTLQFGRNSIGSAGAAALARQLPDCQLTALDISKCVVGLAGLAEMNKALPLSNIRLFEASENRTYDERVAGACAYK
eukprot:PLAT6486.2.p1 GENE.PLAT6486.2~~PLAT6486.2.p1  ORF type:complete len:507 (-),score=174.59 PLAT6486.2:87-1607(-)